MEAFGESALSVVDVVDVVVSMSKARTAGERTVVPAVVVSGVRGSDAGCVIDERASRACVIADCSDDGRIAELIVDVVSVASDDPRADSLESEADCAFADGVAELLVPFP